MLCNATNIYTYSDQESLLVYSHRIPQKKKKSHLHPYASHSESSEFMKANVSILFIHTDIYDYGIAIR